jgi:hypothetical protein
MLRWLRPTLVAMLVLGASACKVKAPDSASLKYGNLPDEGFFMLLDAEPDHPLEICGPYAKYASDAAAPWLKALGRAGRLPIKLSGTCTPDAWPQIEIRDGDAKIDEDCKDPTTVAAVQGTLWNKIVVCRSPAKDPEVKLAPVLLHEFGHLAGLCDQYGRILNVGMSTNCGSFRSVDAAKSIMNGGGSDAQTEGVITADDLLGIHIMACRAVKVLADDSKGNGARQRVIDTPKFGANALWAEAIPEHYAKLRNDPDLNREIRRLKTLVPQQFEGLDPSKLFLPVCDPDNPAGGPVVAAVAGKGAGGDSSAPATPNAGRLGGADAAPASATNPNWRIAAVSGTDTDGASKLFIMIDTDPDRIEYYDGPALAGRWTKCTDIRRGQPPWAAVCVANAQPGRWAAVEVAKGADLLRTSVPIQAASR